MSTSITAHSLTTAIKMFLIKHLALWHYWHTYTECISKVSFSVSILWRKLYTTIQDYFYCLTVCKHNFQVNLMFIGPCIIVIVEKWKTNLMSLAILFHFLRAQHVSDINISIIRSLRVCWWITTSVVLFSVRCWAQKKWNKIASDIKLVFHSSTTFKIRNSNHTL